MYDNMVAGMCLLSNHILFIQVFTQCVIENKGYKYRSKQEKIKRGIDTDGVTVVFHGRIHWKPRSKMQDPLHTST